MSLAPFRSTGDPTAAWSSRLRGSEHFPSPFFDMASMAMPESRENALQWAEYVFQSNGTYRQAMERVISYFITDIEIGAADSSATVGDDEKEKWENFLNNDMKVLSFTQALSRDRACFHGDTLATTRDGVFTLRELSGRTVDVLSRGGVYRPATFRSFGRQSLMEIVLSDGRKLLATPEHRWPALNSCGKPVTITTSELRRDYRLERTVAARPPQNEDFFEGVRHGFTFGDGSQYRVNRSAAYFYGDKETELLRYFVGHGCAPRIGFKRATVYGLPAHYKQLPSRDASASYWYGFVVGFLAADGTVDTYGCAMLTQIDRAPLAAIVEQLPRIGMCAGPIRAQRRITDLRKYNGHGSNAVYDSTIHYVTLLKRFMLPQDFLLAKHRDKFERNYKPTLYGRYIRVKAVRETNIVDEVFCCVEPETHTFVVDNGILTSNCYGNGLASVVVPIRRNLTCPRCFAMFPLRYVYENPQFRFDFKGYEFTASCPACSYAGAWKVNDEPDATPEKLILKRWSPHEIKILHDPFTDNVQYLWDIPPDYKRLIREGRLFHLERVSMPVLQAIKNNQLFKFADGAIYHMKEPTLGGFQNRGWGLSRVLTNFRQVWYVQLLHRYNEAIALDYVIPFRLITPATKSGSSPTAIDPLLSTNMGDFMGQVRSIIKRRRQNPAEWHTLPFPVQYQAIGGDATALAPKELLDQAHETLLNAAGTPVELYRGSMQLQTAPVAMRLFEASWHHLVHDQNDFLRWLVSRVSNILSWDKVTARHKRVTHADDMQRHMALLQLMTGGTISQTTGLRALGLDFADELRLLAEEARKQQDVQTEVQEEQDTQMRGQQVATGAPPAGAPMGQPQGAPPAPGGAPPAPGGGAVDPATGMPLPQPVTSMIQNNTMPQTPEDMMAQAESLAQQLLGLQESQKDSELRALKQKNPVLHDLVKAALDRIRGRYASQGKAMLMAQDFGG